jgi:hypothetical protein
VPRKVFVAGEILTAADVNANLMDQAVMVFDDAAARTTAIPSPTEGMVTYLKDTDSVDKFDGTNFVPVDTSGLVAVKNAIFTGTQTATSVAASANFAVTNLSITHTLAKSTNKLIISAYFGAAGSTEGVGRVGLAVADDGTLINIGNADGSRTRVGTGGKVNATSETSVVTMPALTFVYSPGDTASHTYTVRAINISGSSQNLFINRSDNDGNSGGTSRATSGLVIQEVAV